MKKNRVFSDMSNGGKREGAGRPKGIPNAATTTAREAIAAFVEGNTERLNGLLDAIQDGQKVVDELGIETEKWLRQPDPSGAFKAIMDVCEYHLPKLARQEITGKNGEPFTIGVVKYEEEG